MARTKGSKSTVAVNLSDLNKYLPENAVVQVGTSWLRQFETFYNVKFGEPHSPVKVQVIEPEELEPADEKDAEIRERLVVKPESL